MQRKSNLNIPSWAQGFGVVAIIGGGAYLLYQWNKQRQQALEIKPEATAVQQQDAEIQVYQSTGLKPTYNLSVYTSAANTIEKLLNGCETFSSELQAINEVIRTVKNKLDWAILIKAFGTRKIDDCLMGSTFYSLPTLLKDQLDTAGVYSIDKTSSNGYSDAGAVTNSIDILTKYFSKLNIPF